MDIYRQAQQDGKIVRRRVGMPAVPIDCDTIGISEHSEVDRMLDQLIQKAQNHRRKEQYDQAARILTKAIKLQPMAKILFDHLCEILIETDQIDEALEILKKCRSGNWDLRGMELCVTALERAGRYAEAENALARAFAKGYRSACLETLKGILCHQKGAVASAVECFKAAIAQDDGYGAAYTNQGLMSIEKNDAGAGLALLEKGFVKTPCDSHVMTTFHAAISESGCFDRAEPLFRQALQDHHDHKKLNYLYIDILLQQQKYEAAMAAIKQAIVTFGLTDGILEPAIQIRNRMETSKSKPDGNGRSLSLCMIVKNEQERLAQALNSVKGLADEIIVVDTGSSDNTRDLARIFGAKVYDYKWNDNFADARNEAIAKACGQWILILDADERISPLDHDLVKQAISRSENAKNAYSFTTRNYVNDVGVEGWQVNQGQYAEEMGTGWYPSIKVRLFPNLPSIRFENVVHEKVDGSLVRDGIQVSSLSVPIHHFGDLEADHRNRKKRAYYALGQNKMDSRSGNPEAIVEHAIQAGETGDLRKAVGLWSDILAINPGYARAWFNLGYAYIQLHLYDKAQAASKKALELDPDLKEASLNLSLCEMRIGDVGKAIHLLEVFLTRFPDHPMATGNLGVAYCIDGQTEKGHAYLRRVLRMGFDIREFVAQHDRDLKAGGKPDRAAALMAAMAKAASSRDKNPMALVAGCI